MFFNKRRNSGHICGRNFECASRQTLFPSLHPRYKQNPMYAIGIEHHLGSQSSDLCLSAWLGDLLGTMDGAFALAESASTHVRQGTPFLLSSPTYFCVPNLCVLVNPLEGGTEYCSWWWAWGFENSVL